MDRCTRKLAIHKITDICGAEEIQQRLGVTYSSVRNARTTGVMSCRWRAGVEIMCKEKRTSLKRICSEFGIADVTTLFSYIPVCPSDKNIGSECEKNKSKVQKKAKKPVLEASAGKSPIPAKGEGE